MWYINVDRQEMVPWFAQRIEELNRGHARLDINRPLGLPDIQGLGRTQGLVLWEAEVRPRCNRQQSIVECLYIRRNR